MAEADLSRLDLRHINFKYANLHKAKLTGANLSYCCLERTDLSQANLEVHSLLFLFLNSYLYNHNLCFLLLLHLEQ